MLEDFGCANGRCSKSLQSARFPCLRLGLAPVTTSTLQSFGHVAGRPTDGRRRRGRGHTLRAYSYCCTTELSVLAEIVHVALFVLFQLAEYAIAIFVGNLGKTLSKIFLVDPRVTLIEVATRFRAHHVHAVVATGIAHIRADVLAALLVVTTRRGNVINGSIHRPHRTSRGHERPRRVVLTTEGQETS